MYVRRQLEFLPKSSVIPLSWLWGCLSKLAVDATVLSALAKIQQEYTGTTVK